MSLHRTATSTPAFWLALAACMCNLLVVLLPIGLILGLVALATGTIGSRRSPEAGAPALTLAGVSFVIALIWGLSVAAMFAIDPTLS
ncbi:hypothetical protein [Paenibacillus sp.]|uniref:hypothetical protein n=1 Tax=Paenibacillus sp. TaxID=58172 RepID=UPI002811860D|nr:hypothetical protein [Paenibacillus sp.]